MCVWSETNYLLHKHTESVSALSICHLQQPAVVEGCPVVQRGGFGETPSWHISPGWPWHRAATALLKHFLGLCLCHVGLPRDRVSTTLYPPTVSQKTHSHPTQRSGISTRTWQWEEARLMPASVTIMLTPCGSVPLAPRVCHAWKPLPQGDTDSCWVPTRFCYPPSNLFMHLQNLAHPSDSSSLSVSSNLLRTWITRINDSIMHTKKLFVEFIDLVWNDCCYCTQYLFSYLISFAWCHVMCLKTWIVVFTILFEYFFFQRNIWLLHINIYFVTINSPRQTLHEITWRQLISSFLRK